MPEREVILLEVLYNNLELEKFSNPKDLYIEDGLLYFKTEDGIAMLINLKYVVKLGRRGY